MNIALAPSTHRSGIPKSRGDLLDLWRQFGSKGLGAAAELYGFQKPEVAAQVQKFQTQEEKSGQTATGLTPSPNSASADTGCVYWRVVSHEILPEPAKTDILLDWYQNVAAFSEAELKSDWQQYPPRKRPLIPWSRLWPFLRSALGSKCESRHIDTPRLLAILYKAEMPRQFPRRRQEKWAGVAYLLLDRAERLAWLRDDMTWLHQRVEQVRGEVGLIAIRFDDGPNGTCRLEQKVQSREGPYRLPPPGTPLLLLGDLGMLSGNETLQRGWLRLGRRMRRAGLDPVALVPVAPRSWPEDLAAVWHLVYWDRGTRPARMRSATGGAPMDPAHGARISGPHLGRLLAFCAPAFKILPALLRDLRLCLPAARGGVELEAALWNLEGAQARLTGLDLEPATRERALVLFEAEDAEVQRRVLDLIQSHHRDQSPALLWAEAELGRMYPGGQGRKTGVGFVERLFKTLRKSTSGNLLSRPYLEDWFQKLFPQLPRPLWRGHLPLGKAWAELNREAWKKGVVGPPPGLDLRQVAGILDGDPEPTAWELRQIGESFWLGPSAERASDNYDSFQCGSPVTTLTAGQAGLQGIYRNPEGDVLEAHATGPGSSLTLAIPASGIFEFLTDYDRLALENLAQPEWARGMGRDGKGLCALIPEGEKNRRVYWFNPGRYEIATGESESSSLPQFVWGEGCWMDDAQFDSWRGGWFEKPDWLQRLGVDPYGVYGDAQIKGVVQRFRWIMPGSFFMGSPEDEPERNVDEIQHQVLITRGFWLADTACTQELWQAVTGKTPSKFKGPLRPVENVSWEDVASFFDKTKEMDEKLDWRLPTEAEWEYACRAGTTTRFHFGDSITTEQVNFDGNFPTKGNPKGNGRRETVEVKIMPCNGWGLYETHGNVLEWCADWYGQYGSGMQINPIGDSNGEGRVLRGGSWIGNGRGVRSAYRGRTDPGARNGYCGFRIARN